MERASPVSIRVIEKIAEREGIDPIEMRPPLYGAIDPDWLDEFPSKTTDSLEGRAGQITFTYKGYLVTVESSGHIEVTERAASMATAKETAVGCSDFR